MVSRPRRSRACGCCRAAFLGASCDVPGRAFGHRSPAWFSILSHCSAGLVVTIVKRLIGRARPLVGGSIDPFLYLPLGWNVEYASLPSGHATDAFAAAMAIGALWPKTRPLMWTYAAMIAVSRVALTAHFPSDVLAGAAVGVLGAGLVRAWFASCGLAFAAGRQTCSFAARAFAAREKGCPTANGPIKVAPSANAPIRSCTSWRQL